MVFKDILKFNYGQTHTPIIIFRCEWMKWKDNWRNLTYVRDDVGFLMVTFETSCHLWLSLSYFLFKWHKCYF
jgi:hypothetical protein